MTDIEAFHRQYRIHFLPHFTDGKTEAQRGRNNNLTPPSWDELVQQQDPGRLPQRRMPSDNQAHPALPEVC